MLKWKSYTVVIKLQCLHSVDFMAGIFHLLLFRDQIISIASWYMLGVTCSFYFSVNVGSCGLLGHSIVYCHEVIKPPNQQKPERALRRSNIQQCQLYMIHFPRNLFNLMQMSFKKINSSKREEYSNLTFPSGCGGTQPRKARHEKTYCGAL